MIKFNDVIRENKTKHNVTWTYISDYLERILTAGVSW